jgi:hypothetical protein
VLLGTSHPHFKVIKLHGSVNWGKQFESFQARFTAVQTKNGLNHIGCGLNYPEFVFGDVLAKLTVAKAGVLAAPEELAFVRRACGPQCYNSCASYYR